MEPTTTLLATSTHQTMVVAADGSRPTTKPVKWVMLTRLMRTIWAEGRLGECTRFFFRIVSRHADLYVLLGTAAATSKVDNTASGKGTMMKCMMDIKRVPIMDTTTCISKVLFTVICIIGMGAMMTSLVVAWVGMVGMTTSTADMGGMKGMATGDMMTMVEGMTGTTIMERMVVMVVMVTMVVMVEMADTAITEISYE